MSELNFKEILNSQDFAMTHIEKTYNMSTKDAESLCFTVIECVEDDLKNKPDIYSGFTVDDVKSDFKKSCKEALGYVW